MNWKSIENQRLLQAVIAVKTEDEASRFLSDLMTPVEINEFAKRLKAAEMLLAKIPYSTIEKEAGLSSTTVARVAKWLNGKEGGYKSVISKLHHHDYTQVRSGLS